MSNTSLNASYLPFEILYNVLRLASEHDLRNCALVCKAWLKPAQSIIYTDVKINTISMLEKFHDRIKLKPQLGEHTKTICLTLRSTVESSSSRPLNSFTERQIQIILERVSDLLYNGLPNLQEIPRYHLNTYSPVLRALLNSRLNMLKVLGPPSLFLYDKNPIEKVRYASCITLMRDRVEKLTYLDPKEPETEYLHNTLNQLCALKEIELSSPTSLYQTLEHVTSSCKSLRKLSLLHLGNIGVAEIDDVVPIKNIEYLEFSITDLNMLPYIIRKFPQPLQLDLYLYCDVDIQRSDEFTLILDYLSGIKSVSSNGMLIDRRIPEVMANYWDSVSAKLGSKTVGARYTDACELETYGLDIYPGIEHQFSFHSNILEYDSQHTEVINALGKYIGDFRLGYSIEEEGLYDLPIKRDLPPEFMDHLFTHCPNLRALRFEGWVFRKHDFIHEKLPISELHLRDCLIFGDYLTHLSSSLPQLDRLVIEEVFYCSESVETQSGYVQEYRFSNDPLEIHMPQTSIAIVLFKNFKRKASILHVKLFVISEETHYYYRQQGCLRLSNEEEYSSDSASERIYISCVNKPKFVFRYF